MEFVHRPECEELREAVERGESLVHLGGRPGIGKSRTLEWLADTFEEEYETRIIQLYATHDLESLADDIYHELYDALPLRRRFRHRLRDVSGLWFSSFGVEFDDSSEPLEELGTVAELLPDDSRVVLCLDDVHKLAEEKKDVKEYLERLVDPLPANLSLVSAGRVHFDKRHEAAIEMRPLPREQVEELLESTAGVDERTVERLYEQTDGYPYYLTLLSESNPAVSADGGIPDLPKDEFRRYIEQNYLESLERNEEEFLRKTVPLIELDEHICSLAIPETTRTETRRMLSGLRTRCMVQERDSDDSTPRRYRLHDKFREFLCDLEPTAPTVERLLERLTDAPIEDRRRITDAFAEIAADNPAYLEDFVDRMIEPLHDDDGQVRRNASIIVARLAAEYPERVDSAAISTAMEFLESDEDRLQRAAGRQLADLANSNPEVLEPHIDQLRAIVEQGDQAYPYHTPRIVERLAKQYPEQMRLIVLQMKQKVEKSPQTLHIESIESFGELDELYRGIDFHPAFTTPLDEIDQSETEFTGTGTAPETSAEQTDVLDAGKTTTFRLPETTDLTFTGNPELLHRSQYAEVLKVQYRTDGNTKPAVLKQLLTDKRGFTRQFESEIGLWSKIDDHENIVTLIESGTEPNRWFLMEYLDGGSLADRLNQEGDPARRTFDSSTTERVIDGICAAIDYAHEHDIVHGDLTPSNVLFASDTGWHPQVSDWGQAQQLTGVSETTMVYSATAPTVEGVTLPYAAPEMVDPDTFGEIDRQTDIYQLATVAYELYTGRRPFTASTPAALMREHLEERPPLPSEVSNAVPPGLDLVFEKALAKDKSERYQTAGELRAALLD